MNKMLVSAAIAGIFVAGIATAQAADAPKVKCFGIAKAGKNDCKASDSSHACKGQAKADGSKVDFSLVADKAACDAAKGTVGN
jgi:uncharacterized membrane protein